MGVGLPAGLGGGRRCGCRLCPSCGPGSYGSARGCLPGGACPGLGVGAGAARGGTYLLLQYRCCSPVGHSVAREGAGGKRKGKLLKRAQFLANVVVVVLEPRLTGSAGAVGGLQAAAAGSAPGLGRAGTRGPHLHGAACPATAPESGLRGRNGAFGVVPGSLAAFFSLDLVLSG